MTRHLRRAVGPATYAVALAASVVVIVVQPLGSPWWNHADADATYTSSALNLAAGYHTKYFDHPGLPVQEAGAAAFALWHGYDRLTGTAGSMHAFSARIMLDLNRARPVFRGLAILFYLLGATALFLVGRSALGNPFWGLAAAILWTGAPGLMVMSDQFRPDVLLSWLCVVCVYFAARGYRRRSSESLLVSAGLLGFTVMVKLHAAGLLPALALAVLLAGPFPDWRRGLADALRRRRRALLAAAVVWLALSTYFDSSRIPFHPRAKGVAIILGIALLAAAWAVAGRTRMARSGHRLVRVVASDFNGALVAALLVGVLVPVVVVLDDGIASLPWVANALLGRGVNSGVAALPLSRLFVQPLWPVTLLVAVAVVSAGVGALRRDWEPAIWALGSVVTGVMAIERLGTPHYFAPAYALAIVPALQLVQRSRRATPAVALGLVVAVAGVPWWHLRAGTHSLAAPTAPIARLLRPGEVALTDPNAQFRGTLYDELVVAYVDWTPPFPFTTLPLSPAGTWMLDAMHLRPRYYVSASPLPPGTSTIDGYVVSGKRVATVHPYGVYRILAGPGLTEPLPAPPQVPAPRLIAP